MKQGKKALAQGLLRASKRGGENCTKGAMSRKLRNSKDRAENLSGRRKGGLRFYSLQYAEKGLWRNRKKRISKRTKKKVRLKRVYLEYRREKKGSGVTIEKKKSNFEGRKIALLFLGKKKKVLKRRRYFLMHGKCAIN